MYYVSCQRLSYPQRAEEMAAQRLAGLSGDRTHRPRSHASGPSSHWGLGVPHWGLGRELGSRRLHLIPGVIRAAHQWPALHMAEPHRLARLRVLTELLRRHLALDRHILLGRLELLPDGHDVYPPRMQIL